MTSGRQLEAWARRPTSALALRSRIVLLAADGLKNVEIARELGVHRPMVTKRRGRFAEQRLDGLVDERGPVIPPDSGLLRRHGWPFPTPRRRVGHPDHTHFNRTDPGTLLHIDAFEVPKFAVPGHWAASQRAEQYKTRRAGKTVVVGIVDDHTRLAYCELHSAENVQTVSATLRRAAAWMREQGCGPVQAVMSDNAKCDATSHAFRDTLTELDARHILIPPYTPRWKQQDRALLRDARQRVGARPRLAQQQHPRPRPVIVHALSTTDGARTQPPAADRPSPASTKSASRTCSSARCSRSSCSPTRGCGPHARAGATSLTGVNF